MLGKSTSRRRQPHSSTVYGEQTPEIQHGVKTNSAHGIHSRFHIRGCCPADLPGASRCGYFSRLDGPNSESAGRRTKMERTDQEGKFPSNPPRVSPAITSTLTILPHPVLQRPQNLPRPRPQQLPPHRRRSSHHPRLGDQPTQATSRQAHHRPERLTRGGATARADARRDVGRAGGQEGG